MVNFKIIIELQPLYINIINVLFFSIVFRKNDYHQHPNVILQYYYSLFYI